MMLDECRALLIPLALATRADFDGPTQRAYHRGLSEVPLMLLQAAVDRALMGARFMPSVGELRRFAEEARLALKAAHPFVPCVECSNDGWREIDVEGVKRVTRCRCWQAHQARLRELGVGSEPVGLLEGEAVPVNI